ncbi:VOC family protein [Sphaerotilaceae bacterium SBD11-9]
MTTARNAIHEVFAYLTVPDTQKAVEFYTQAFGATELFRLTEPSGRIGHVELQLAPHAILMLADPFPEFGLPAPPPEGLPGMRIHLHVDNCDDMARAAVAAGATLLSEPADQFYGERSCRLRDPFGHSWLIGHSIEKLTPEEMQQRYTELLSQ